MAMDILSVLIKRFSVSSMQDFFLNVYCQFFIFCCQFSIVYR